MRNPLQRLASNHACDSNWGRAFSILPLMFGKKDSGEYARARLINEGEDVEDFERIHIEDEVGQWK